MRDKQTKDATTLDVRRMKDNYSGNVSTMYCTIERQNLRTPRATSCQGRFSIYVSEAFIVSVSESGSLDPYESPE